MFVCLPLRGGVVIRSVALSLVVSCSLACLIGFNPKQPPAPKRAHGSQHGSGPGLDDLWHPHYPLRYSV